jgi:hypothetical protein
VSEAALERLAKRAGLENIWEDDMGGSGSRTLIIAGSALQLEVVIAKDVVQTASLSFPESAEVVGKHAEKAGQILLDDLKLAPGQSPLTKRMHKFADNFERLANLDKLSVNPGLNLFEAIGGIYESLERLYNWDLRRLREDPALNGKSDEYLVNMVMCTKHGRPIMHARGRIGLSIDYWKERRLFPPRSERTKAFAATHDQYWSMLVVCAPMRGAGQPVRVSDKWISMDVEKVSGPEDLQPGPALEWLQPDNTVLEPSAEKTGDAATSLLLAPKLPEVTFLAVFDPPLHVPVSVFEMIYQRVGTLPAPDFTMLPTLDSLLLPSQSDKKVGVSDPAEPRVITRVRRVDVLEPGEGPDRDLYTVTHWNRLIIYSPQTVYGKTLTELPFSHPEQLIGILPLLRQYAFLSSLMRNSFSQDLKPQPSTPAPFSSRAAKIATTYQEDYENLMSGENAAAADMDADIAVSFAAFPQPSLTVLFPFRDSTASVSMIIEENGHVHVTSQNVLDDSNSMGTNGQPRRPEQLGKMLEMFEDIGRWVQFIRTRWST